MPNQAQTLAVGSPGRRRGIAGLMAIAIAATSGALLAATAPLPEPNPARLPSRTIVEAPDIRLPEPHPRRAILDPGEPPLPERRPAPVEAWSEAEIASARAECAEVLQSVVADVALLAPLRIGACGTPQPIEVRSIGSPALRFDPPAVINCQLLAALDRWRREVVDPLALATLGEPVVGIANGSGYACRNRDNAAEGKLSEHARANALDVSAFVTGSGRRIAVADHWGPALRDIAVIERTKADEAAALAAAAAGTASTVVVTAAVPGEPPLPERRPVNAVLAATAPVVLPTRQRGKIVTRPSPYRPTTSEGRFVEAVHAGSCAIFATVLGPEANDAHRDHFHLDLQVRRGSSFCE